MKPPHICGKWTYTGKIIKINTFGQEPDICKPEPHPIRPAVIEQNGVFVKIGFPNVPGEEVVDWKLFGGWNPVCQNGKLLFWELTLVNQPDYGKLVYTVAKCNKKGQPIKLIGTFSKAGFDNAPAKFPEYQQTILYKKC